MPTKVIDIAVDEYEDAWSDIVDASGFRAEIVDQSFDHAFGTERREGYEFEQDNDVLVRYDLGNVPVNRLATHVVTLTATQKFSHTHTELLDKYGNTAEHDFDMMVTFDLIGVEDGRYLVLSPEIIEC